MNDLAFIIPYFNFTGSELIRLRYAEALARFRLVTPHVYGIEASLTDRFDFAGEPDVRCYTVKSFLWYKENLINKAIRDLDPNFTKVAWIDGDMEIVAVLLAEVVSARLDDVEVLQIGNRYELLNRKGEFSSMIHPALFAHRNRLFGNGACPGMCWAARRESLARVGYLPEREIIGGGDRSFLMGLLSGLSVKDWAVNHYKIAGDYRDGIAAYVEKVRQQRLTWDYLPVTAKHHYHSAYGNRMYTERCALTETFKQEQLTVDENGLLVLNNPVMEAGFRKYFEHKDKVDQW